MGFIKSELAAAVRRGVRQCVIVGSRPELRNAVLASSENEWDLFTVAEDEALPTGLQRSAFDEGKASLFLWLGDAGFRSLEVVVSGLALIGSLPSGSGVLLDYVAERSGVRNVTRAALDALASRLQLDGRIAYCIQPQAVAAMLRAVGFREIADIADEEIMVPGARLVSAVV